MQTKIPCVLMRGGTSKGPFFLASHLPQDSNLRDAVLIAAMGSPHEYQVDGIRGRLVGAAAELARRRQEVSRALGQPGGVVWPPATGLRGRALEPGRLRCRLPVRAGPG